MNKKLITKPTNEQGLILMDENEIVEHGFVLVDEDKLETIDEDLIVQLMQMTSLNFLKLK